MMIRKIAAAFAAVFVLRSLTRQAQEIELIPVLEDFDLKPGAWFQVYLCDWMLAHNIIDPEHVTSGIARGAESGDYIWATATPEWDNGWFNSHGWRFPQKWVPFHYLATSEGEPGDPCQLRGL